MGFKNIGLIISLFIITTVLSGQGLSRSKGIGFRGGLWKQQMSSSHTDLYGQERGSDFDWGGGGFACFFLRLKGHLFLEAALGGGGSMGGMYNGDSGNPK